VYCIPLKSITTIEEVITSESRNAINYLWMSEAKNSCVLRKRKSSADPFCIRLSVHIMSVHLTIQMPGYGWAERSHNNCSFKWVRLRVHFLKMSTFYEGMLTAWNAKLSLNTWSLNQESNRRHIEEWLRCDSFPYLFTKIRGDARFESQFRSQRENIDCATQWPEVWPCPFWMHKSSRWLARERARFLEEIRSDSCNSDHRRFCDQMVQCNTFCLLCPQFLHAFQMRDERWEMRDERWEKACDIAPSVCEIKRGSAKSPGHSFISSSGKDWNDIFLLLHVVLSFVLDNLIKMFNLIKEDGLDLFECQVFADRWHSVRSS
jgi:hypothetical protein